jgi:hypothetical protein
MWQGRKWRIWFVEAVASTETCQTRKPEGNLGVFLWLGSEQFN